MPDARTFQTVCVIGAGAWGTALANVAARAGRNVILWGRDAATMAQLKETRDNTAHLPGIPLENSVQVTSDPSAALGADLALAVVPAQALRNVVHAFSMLLGEGLPVVVCAKGIERGTQNFMSDVVRQTMPGCVPAILSGPSFAHDVAAGLPTAVTIAAPDLPLAERLGNALTTNTFRLYHSDDVRGVEIGGAAKNVLAIACGIAIGRGLGASAHAALIARGFAELRRFGVAFGANPDTLMGLSGLGDLVLTAGSEQSRNFAFGHALGRGLPPKEAAGGKLTEGIFTARVLVEMAQGAGIDMPIAQAVDAILTGKLSIDDAVEGLLSRPRKIEG